MNYSDHIRDKQRIVFAGSEGCDSLAALVSYVLTACNRPAIIIENDRLIRDEPHAAVALIIEIGRAHV